MDELFCTRCGKQIADGWVSKSGFCHPCASEVRTERELEAKKPSEKDWLTAVCLCVFLGAVGAHRFYVGKTGTAIIWLFTLGCFGVGAIVDVIKIANETFTDAKGNTILTNANKAKYSEAIERKTRSAENKPKAKEPLIIADNCERMDFRVSGVTFRNDDGTSRQDILKSAKAAIAIGDDLVISFVQDEYKGKPRVAVNFNDKCVGNIEYKKVEQFAKIQELVTSADADIDYVDTDDDEKVLYCHIYVTYKT